VLHVVIIYLGLYLIWGKFYSKYIVHVTYKCSYRVKCSSERKFWNVFCGALIVKNITCLVIMKVLKMDGNYSYLEILYVKIYILTTVRPCVFCPERGSLYVSFKTIYVGRLISLVNFHEMALQSIWWRDISKDLLFEIPFSQKGHIIHVW